MSELHVKNSGNVFFLFFLQILHRWCELIVKHKLECKYETLRHFLFHHQVRLQPHFNLSDLELRTAIKWLSLLTQTP